MPPRPIPSLKILLIWRMVLLAFSDPLFVTSYICSVTSAIFQTRATTTTHTKKKPNLIQPTSLFFYINPNYLSESQKTIRFIKNQSKASIVIGYFDVFIWNLCWIEERFSLGILKNKTLNRNFSLEFEVFRFRFGIYIRIGREQERERVVFTCDWAKIYLDKKREEYAKKSKLNSRFLYVFLFQLLQWSNSHSFFCVENVKNLINIILLIISII